MTKVEWTDDELEVRGELVRSRKLDELVAELSEYKSYDTLAYISECDVKLKPAQAKAWAAFAETLTGDIIMNANSIQRLKPKDERERNAVREEIKRREREQ